jgi:hypothetical protein
MTPPRGKQAPQTIESLQEIMAADAVLFEAIDTERLELKKANRKLRIKLLHLRRNK